MGKIEGGEALGLTIAEHQRRFYIRNELLRFKTLGAPPWSEFGPDLALIGLPSHAYSAIQARKSFYSLSKRKQQLPGRRPRIRGSVWVVIGAAVEKAQSQCDELVIPMTAWFSGFDRPIVRAGFDYYDLSINRIGTADLPASFGDVSGGGLWKERPRVNPQTREVEWDENLSLEGVAFYQFDSAGGKGAIRCHGRRSLYVKMLDEARRQ